MLGVGDGIPDDVLQEQLQHAPGLLVDQPRDPLDTSMSGQLPDGRLGDALLDVIPLGSAFPKSLAPFATSRLVQSCMLSTEKANIITYKRLKI